MSPPSSPEPAQQEIGVRKCEQGRMCMHAESDVVGAEGREAAQRQHTGADVASLGAGRVESVRRPSNYATPPSAPGPSWYDKPPPLTQHVGAEAAQAQARGGPRQHAVRAAAAAAAPRRRVRRPRPRQPALGGG